MLLKNHWYAEFIRIQRFEDSAWKVNSNSIRYMLITTRPLRDIRFGIVLLALCCTMARLMLIRLFNLK